MAVRVVGHYRFFLEDVKSLCSEPAHAQHVDQGVHQGVEGHCDDVGQQPDVLLQEHVLDVFLLTVHRYYEPDIVEENWQVEDDVDGGDYDDGHSCFLLHLGDGGGAPGDSHREQDDDSGGDAADSDGDYGEC